MNKNNVKLPVAISPLENPSTMDRITRMMIAVLVNSGTEKQKAFELVMGGNQNALS